MTRIPFFSIIIPVYNVEAYLENCVKSVLKQDFTDYEIILVNDGSTDGSGELCNRLGTLDDRIQVIHQENQGLSGARNTGLKQAVGELVLFLDSDDFYPQVSFLNRLHGCWHGEDLICFNYGRYTDHLKPPAIQFPPLPNNPEKVLETLIKANAYTSSAWSKAIRRSLLVDNSIEFERDTLSEDIEWSGTVLLKARSAAVAPDCIYAYRVRADSITRTIRYKHVLDQCRIVQRMAAREVAPELQEVYRNYTAFQYCTIMINIHLSSEKPDAETLRQIQAMDWLLQYDANRIVKLVHIVNRLLGFSITSWLLYYYFKIFCW